MFAIAFLLGLFANCVFLLGLANLFSKPLLIGFTIIYIFLAVFFWQKFDEKIDIKEIKKEVKELFSKHTFLVVSILVALSVTFIGALAPETAFDALWYHLTLPKLFLSFGGIRFIPGGLFYYSVMPKVGEMLYSVSLAFGSVQLAHFVQFASLVFICIAIYCIARKYTNMMIALFSVIVFLSNIVVLWEATIAYIDLIRTFFEIMALWGILNYLETKHQKWLIEAGFLFGLAVETKLVALAGLPIFLVALLFFGFKNLKGKVIDVVIFTFLSLLVSLPWFVFAINYTGNPIYPLLSGYLHLDNATLVFPQTITDMITVFVTASDPISPIYLILLPLFFLIRKRLTKRELMLVTLCGMSLLMWTLTPKTGGGRFLLPYLPLFSITACLILYHLDKKSSLFKISFVSVILLFWIAVGYRSLAQLKSLPVVFGLESQEKYLKSHLNFGFGDYYDSGGKIKSIVGDKNVLLFGFHNEFYVDFPFIDSSFVQKGDSFGYIATQNTALPKRFSYWKPIFFDPVTKVTLYTLGPDWIY